MKKLWLIFLKNFFVITLYVYWYYKDMPDEKFLHLYFGIVMCFGFYYEYSYEKLRCESEEKKLKTMKV